VHDACGTELFVKDTLASALALFSDVFGVPLYADFSAPGQFQTHVMPGYCLLDAKHVFEPRPCISIFTLPRGNIRSYV
jgi:hypothetical protein